MQHDKPFPTRSLALLGLATVLTGGLAQAQDPFWRPMTTRVLEHPSGLTGVPSQAVAGQLSDDAIADAVVLHGTTAWFLYAADRRSVWNALSGSYCALATLPGPTAGLGDSVLAASPTGGLVHLTFDDNPSVFTLTPTALSGFDSWQGAMKLQVVPSGGQTCTVMALSVDADAILTATWNRSTGVLTPGIAHDLAGPANALVGLNLDGDSAVEFAVADSTGLRLLEDDGVVITSISEPNNESLLLAIDDASTGPGAAVVWLREAMPSVEKLSVVLPGGTQEPYHLYYGVDVDHIALMNLGEDDRDELVLTAGTFDLGIGLRRGTTETFQGWPSNYAFWFYTDRARSAKQPQPNPAPGPGSGVCGSGWSSPALAVYDFDGDGDDDLFAAGHPGQADQAMIFLGVKYKEELRRTEAGAVKPWMAEYRFQVNGTYGGPQSGTLDFDAPVVSSGPATQATHARYIVRAQAAAAAYPDTAPLVAPILHDLASGNPITFTLPNLQQLGDGAKLHLEISFHTYSGNPALGGVMTRSFPALLETVPVDLQDNSLILFQDSFDPNNDDGSTSGSTARPPVSPPSGGGGTSTP